MSYHNNRSRGYGGSYNDYRYQNSRFYGSGKQYRDRYNDDYAPKYNRHRSEHKHGQWSNGVSTDQSQQNESFDNSPDKPGPSLNGDEKRNTNTGTDPVTGINSHDSKFDRLCHHIDYQSGIEFSSESSSAKSYKVLYDPDTDKALSKTERKQKSKKIRFNGEGLSGSALADPRRTNVTLYFTKPNKKSKKFPFKQLPQPKFSYDKDSLGKPPQTELVMWDLPSITTEAYLTNFIKSYGDSIKNLKLISDPTNAVPLGVATFKFNGSVDKAVRSAKKFIQTIKTEQPKIDGDLLKVDLNDSESKFLNSKVEIAKNRILAARSKREKEERIRSKKIEIEEKRKKDEQRKELEHQANQNKEPKRSKQNTNTTILSARFNNKVVKGIFLPKELVRHIKDRPYILIRDKYVSTKKILSQDIKRSLNKYDWTRVMTDRTGFYIVFNSLKECERCFKNEDGRRFFEFSMFMEMAIPESYSDANVNESHGASNAASNKKDVVDEAANMLIKEFEIFLAKDIRERIIAPVILDLLNPEKYPNLMKDLKSKETQKPVSVVNTSNQIRQNAIFLLNLKKKSQSELPSFKKKEDVLKKRLAAPSGQKKNIIPVQHALNYDNESESDAEDEEEDDISSRSNTSSVPPLKRDHSSTITSDYVDDSPGDTSKKHKPSLRKSLLFESSSDGEDGETTAAAPGELEDALQEKLYSDVHERYQPTFDQPTTVYEESDVSAIDVLNLTSFVQLIKDKEDIALAKEVVEHRSNSTEEIQNIQYWAWKQRQFSADLEEIAEDEDLIGSLGSHLESLTGSFRSEGYKKIPEAVKIEYLPHRRIVHKPLKTVQNDDDEVNGGSSNSGNFQSSRVNRANNRRFAADITAQIGNETEILSLNALTKRKKPVSFARSAIHNWGLYALEPIAAKEMIIEYVGESIRQQVAEHREKSYLKTGIGSSYLFRVDEDTVIDATKKGGIARFINHCCDPNCTAKIIKVEGKKRIVIYALRDIDTNEELTYDYKFERETNDAERIRCLCGAATCKGYLN